jgi:hypothetical protein
MDILKVKAISDSINQLENELKKETGFEIGQYVFSNYGVLVEIKSIFVEDDEILAFVTSGDKTIRVRLKNLKKID